METLDNKTREDIKKMSEARLALKLSQVGYEVEQLEKLDRAALLHAWATTVSQGKDKLPVAPSALGYDVELEKRKLEFEFAKWQAEKERLAQKDEEKNITETKC